MSSIYICSIFRLFVLVVSNTNRHETDPESLINFKKRIFLLTLGTRITVRRLVPFILLIKYYTNILSPITSQTNISVD